MTVEPVESIECHQHHDACPCRHEAMLKRIKVLKAEAGNASGHIADLIQQVERLEGKMQAEGRRWALAALDYVQHLINTQAALHYPMAVAHARQAIKNGEWQPEMRSKDIDGTARPAD